MTHEEAIEAAAEAMADVHDMDVPWETYAEAAVSAYLAARGMALMPRESDARSLRAMIEIIQEGQEADTSPDNIYAALLAECERNAKGKASK